MTLELPDDLAETIEWMTVVDGYDSPLAVVTDAVYRLKRECDLAAIRAGLDDVAAGRVIPHEEVVRQMKERYPELRNADSRETDGGT